MIRLFLLTCLCIAPLQALIILPRQESTGEKIGKASSESFSESMKESRKIRKEKELREQLQKEQRIATEIDHYNSVVSQLSCEPAHTTLTLPQELTQPFIYNGYIKMCDNRTMKYVFKRKFNRILSEGKLVEWLWSLDVINENPINSPSSGILKYPKARFKIELLDDKNFCVSSCVFYADLFLKRGESTTLQGKWMIPYDQVSHVSSYQICIGYLW